MELNLSFQEKIFYFSSSLKIKGHLFIIFDKDTNQISKFRLSLKSPPSLVDKGRTLFSLVKTLSLKQKSNSFILNGGLIEYFSSSETIDRFVDKHKNKILIHNDEIIEDLIEFFLKKPILAWNNLTYPEALKLNPKIQSKEVIDLFNLSLKKPNINNFSEEKEHPFLILNFDSIEKNYDADKETLKVQKEKLILLKGIKQLEFFQSEYLKKKLNNTKLLDTYLSTFFMLEKTFLECTSYEENLNTKVLLNSQEFSCILLNSGISVSKNRTFYVSFLKLVYFFLFCLGISLNDVFFIKKDELLKISKAEINSTITFNLNEKKIDRTISFETKNFFSLLQEDIENTFFFNVIFTKIKQKKNITIQSLRFLVNKDLDEICENLKIQKVRVESLELGAIISLRLNFSFEYVIKEYKISKSFLKRLERLYEINII